MYIFAGLIHTFTAHLILTVPPNVLVPATTEIMKMNTVQVKETYNKLKLYFNFGKIQEALAVYKFGIQLDGVKPVELSKVNSDGRLSKINTKSTTHIRCRKRNDMKPLVFSKTCTSQEKSGIFKVKDNLQSKIDNGDKINIANDKAGNYATENDYCVENSDEDNTKHDEQVNRIDEIDHNYCQNQTETALIGKEDTLPIGQIQIKNENLLVTVKRKSEPLKKVKSKCICKRKACIANRNLVIELKNSIREYKKKLSQCEQSLQEINRCQLQNLKKEELLVN